MKNVKYDITVLLLYIFRNVQLMVKNIPCNRINALATYNTFNYLIKSVMRHEHIK